MLYHPAIGDIRQQLPRVAVIAALFVAAATLIGLNTQRASLPSERWYQVSRQQVMEADLIYRLGDAAERVAGTWLPAEARGKELMERGVALWERRALGQRPTPAAAYRLGVIYGHRGYGEYAADMLTLAAGLDEDSSDYYHALAEVYSRDDLTREELRRHTETIAQRSGWLVDIALGDCYRRLGDEDQAEAVARRQHQRASRFLAGITAVSVTLGLLLVTGLSTIVVLLVRRGLRLRRLRAPLPFAVPWTLVDVAEAVAVLLFALVVAGLISPDTPEPGSGPSGEGTMRALLMGVQYVLVVGATIVLIIVRIRPRSSHPWRALGMRFGELARLVGIGIAGYAVFLTGILAVGVILGSMFGGAVALAQTTEEIIGSAGSTVEIVLYLVLVSVLAPLAEETIFRGYVYGGLRRFLPARQAIILGGLVFAAVHLNADALLVITAIGALLCYLYERTRSLVPGIVAHALHNGLVLLIMLLQSM